VPYNTQLTGRPSVDDPKDSLLGLFIYIFILSAQAKHGFLVVCYFITEEC